MHNKSEKITQSLKNWPFCLYLLVVLNILDILRLVFWVIGLTGIKDMRYIVKESQNHVVCTVPIMYGKFTKFRTTPNSNTAVICQSTYHTCVSQNSHNLQRRGARQTFEGFMHSKLYRCFARAIFSTSTDAKFEHKHELGAVASKDQFPTRTISSSNTESEKC